MKTFSSLLGFLCLSLTALQASPLPLPQKTYIYPISQEEVLQYRKGQFEADKQWNDRQAIDSLISAQNIPGQLRQKRMFGYYLTGYYNANGFTVQLVNNALAQPRLVKWDKKHWRLYLYDSTGYVRDFSVKAGKRTYDYNPACNCAVIKGKTLPKDPLIVEKDEAFLIIDRSEVQGGNKKQVFRLSLWRRFLSWFDFSRPAIEPGFIVMNQTQYRMMDSLYAKAYLVDQRGRPYTGDVRIRVTNSRRGKTYIDQEADYQSPGSYHFQWRIPDSLQLDQMYSIQFLSEKEPKVQKWMSFLLTNFESQDFTIKMDQSSAFIFPDKPAQIIVSALDKNEIPIPGSRVDIRYYINGIGNLHAAKIYVPDSASQNWHSESLFMIPDKEMYIEIPVEKLPPADLRLQAYITVTTPNNDVRTRVLTFQKIQRKEDYSYEMGQDSIHLFFLVNEEKAASDTVEVVLYDNFFNQEIRYKTTLPHSVPEIHRYSNLTLYEYPQRTQKLRVPFRYTYITLSGTKTTDSLMLEFNNDQYGSLYWEMFYRGDRIRTGKEKSVQMALKGDDPVHLVYTYLQGNNLFIQRQSIIPGLKSLQVSHDIPVKTYPGQEVAVQLQVRDFENDPVKNANVTALSMNTQMPVINAPNIPNYNKKQVDGPNPAIRPYNPLNPSSRTYRPDTLNYRELGFYRHLYYRLFHNPDGIYSELDTQEYPVSQLWSMARLQHQSNTTLMKEIWVDDKPVFLNTGNIRQAYTLEVPNGWHRLRVKTHKELIEWDSFYFAKGKLTFLGVSHDLLHRSSHVKRYPVESNYGVEELANIGDQFLEITLSPTFSREAYLETGKKIIDLHALNAKYVNNHYSYSATLYGPVEEGMVRLFNRDTSISFYFNPGLYYYFTSNNKLQYREKGNRNYQHYQLVDQSHGFNFEPALTQDTLQARWLRDSLDQVEKEKINARQNPTRPVNNGRNLFTGYAPQHFGHEMLYMRNMPQELASSDFIWMQAYDSLYYSHFREGYYGNIKVGNHDFRIITGRYRQQMMEIDTLRMKAGHSLYIRMDSLLKPMDPEHWKAMQYAHYKTLQLYGAGKQKIFDAPYVSEETETNSDKAQMEGWVLHNQNYAINAFVLLIGKDGKHRYLRSTNSQGFFNFFDLEPGNYWMQIITNNRQIFFTEELKVRSGIQNRVTLDCVSNDQIKARMDRRKRKVKIGSSDQKYKSAGGGNAAVQGAVIDKETGEPLAFGNVILKQDGILVAGNVTDMDGKFYLRGLKPGQYELEISFLGYETQVLQGVIVKESQITQLDIKLKQQESNLAEVAIMAQKKESVQSYSNVSPSYQGTYDVEMEEIQRAPRRRDRSLKVTQGIVADAQSRNGQYSWEFGDEDGNAEKNRLQDIKNDPNANRIRDNFKNNAFWFPNLITDSDGKTGFTFIMPDDETRWINFLVAAKGTTNTLNTSYTRSYKPLSARLRMPQFVTRNDRIFIPYTLRNLTGDTLQLSTTFKHADKSENAEVTLGSYERKEKDLTISSREDSLELSFSLDYDGYIDGERRKIPINSDEVMTRKAKSLFLEEDDAYSLLADAKANKRTMVIQSGLRNLIYHEMDQLRRYHYGCNEQTASKLFALLYEKELKSSLGERFYDDQEIVKMIHILEKRQHSDGGWSWWNNGPTDHRISMYVTEGLVKAQQLGFHVKREKRAVGNLVNRYNQLDEYGQITTLLLASRIQFRLDYNSKIQALSRQNLNLYAQLRLMELKLERSLSVDMQAILKELKRDGKKIYLDAPSGWGFNAQTIALTTQAYKVLARSAEDHEATLKGMRRFLFNNTQYITRNTFQRAQIIMALAQSVQAEKVGMIQVELNGKLISSGEPFTPDAGKLNLVNKGLPVSVVYLEEHISQNPPKVSNGVSIHTYFRQGNRKAVQQLESGKTCQLVVEVKMDSMLPYMMLNVPIPSGFLISSKPTASGWEAAREYYADHIEVAYNKLSKGKHTLVFELLPQFDGEFALMPATMEQMYDPSVFGNELKKRVKVVGP